jgi:hypothetical protein
MKRTYKKRALFDLKRLGQVAFTLFIIFIAYKILTPPSHETARLTAPDGSKTARLKTFFYYNNQPSYRIYYRENGNKIWQSLFTIPAYTNIPVETAKPELQWNNNSDRIDFIMNGTSIWFHVFSN